MNEKLNEIVTVVNAHQQHLINITNFLKKMELRVELVRSNIDSKSQYLQDLFVLAETNNKFNGYFVEFGATDGFTGSNTFLLEKKYGWNGILAEPARCWAESLKKSRKCNIDTRCVWSESNKIIEFSEIESATLSTANIFLGKDMHANGRASGVANQYTVETTSLIDLLDQHSAPHTIDYLSVDTEGSEYLILSNFDFSKYDINIITVEHNWTSDREKIFQLLTSVGYVRKHQDLTDCDDWYVKQKI